VANIFGAIIAKIQENMLKASIYDIPVPGSANVSGTDAAYTIFLVIAIIGYCCVPSVANYIVNAGGGNVLVQKVTSLTSSSVKSIGSPFSGSMSADQFGNGASRMSGSVADNATSNDYFKDKVGGK
jgi:hypothetical protein